MTDLEKLRMWQKSYYEKGVRMVSDTEYDQLLAYLIRQGDYTHEIFDAPAPTSATLVVHRHHMYSMKNLYTIDEVAKWAKDKFPLYVSLKRDGLAIAVKYGRPTGLLTSVSLRGRGGLRGMDVTVKFRDNKHLPKKIPITDLVGLDEVELHAECFIPDQIYRHVLASKYTSHLSAASGILSNQIQDDPQELSYLRVEFYGSPDLSMLSPTHRDDMDYMRDVLKLPVVEGMLCSTIEEVASFYTERQKRLPDATADGVVLRVNDSLDFETYGYTSTHPRAMMAYKFPSEKLTSTILSIRGSLGFTGRLTPTLEIAPLKIGSKTVTSLQVPNFRDIVSRNYATGAEIEVFLGGGVIPQAGDVVTPATERTFVYPQVCPACLEKLEEIGASLRCTNDLCQGVLVEKVIRSLGHQGLGLKNIAREDITELVETDRIVGVFDLLANVAEFVEPQYKKLRTKLLSVSGKSVSSVVLMTMLSIPNLTKMTAEKIATHQNFILGQLYEILSNETTLMTYGITRAAAETISQHISRRGVYYHDQIDHMIRFVTR